MAPRTANLAEPDICREVVDAALHRFIEVGYNKTTMAEIAEDIGMSAANLYRYFANKQDIAAACCAKSMGDNLDKLRLIATSNKSFAEQLEEYALTMVEHTHAMAAPDSKIGELVAFITKEHAEVVHEKLTMHYALLAEMLERATDNGEIKCLDVDNTAQYIYSAFVVFDVPLFIGFYSKDEYKRRARGISALIVKGLTSKG